MKDEEKPEVPIEKPEPVNKEIIEAMTRAQFGTPSQISSIESHMQEYFTRWPNYKDKFTHLEWYHIFLDFSDFLQSKSEPAVKCSFCNGTGISAYTMTNHIPCDACEGTGKGNKLEEEYLAKLKSKPAEPITVKKNVETDFTGLPLVNPFDSSNYEGVWGREYTSMPAVEEDQNQLIGRIAILFTTLPTLEAINAVKSKFIITRK